MVSGKSIIVLEGHTNTVMSAGFTPDGTRIVTASADYTARVWPVLPSSQQALVAHAKRIVPRCLSPKQLRSFYLPPEPPRWCITGPGLEAETDPAKWQPKWPYHTEAWRVWLAARDGGENPPLPNEGQ